MKRKAKHYNFVYRKDLHDFIFDWLHRGQADYASNNTFIITYTPTDSEEPVQKVLPYTVVKMRMRQDWRDYCEKEGRNFSTKEFQVYFDWLFNKLLEDSKNEAERNRLKALGVIQEVEGDLPTERLE